SLIRQTHTRWVCLINDDASDNQSFEAIKAITEGDPRFYVARNQHRLGFYHNSEACIARVPLDADFVAPCDQDDEWYPDKLDCELAAFTTDTRLVYSDMEIIAEDGTLLSPTYWKRRVNNYESLRTLFLANTVTGSASVFRADMLEDILPFPVERGSAFHDHWL